MARICRLDISRERGPIVASVSEKTPSQQSRPETSRGTLPRALPSPRRGANEEKNPAEARQRLPPRWKRRRHPVRDVSRPRKTSQLNKNKQLPDARPSSHDFAARPSRGAHSDACGDSRCDARARDSAEMQSDLSAGHGRHVVGRRRRLRQRRQRHVAPLGQLRRAGDDRRVAHLREAPRVPRGHSRT